MTDVKKDINRLCTKLYLEVEETSKDFFRVGHTREDFDMGFHTSTYFSMITGSGKEVLRFLRYRAGECTAFTEDEPAKSLLTLSEATWITDLLRLPSNRVDDVRAAVTRVMEARRE